jgi:hypothetical protein
MAALSEEVKADIGIAGASMTNCDESLQTHCVFQTEGLSHEIYPAIVFRRLRTLRSASVIEYGNTQCARRRSRLSHLRGGSDR